MRTLKIHQFTQFQKGHISGTACARKVNFLQTGFFTLFHPQAKFGEDSKAWVHILQKKYKLSMD